MHPPTEDWMFIALVVAIHRAGGVLRVSRTEYQRAVRAAGMEPGAAAGFFPREIDDETFEIRFAPDDRRLQ